MSAKVCDRCGARLVGRSLEAHQSGLTCEFTAWEREQQAKGWDRIAPSTRAGLATNGIPYAVFDWYGLEGKEPTVYAPAWVGVIVGAALCISSVDLARAGFTVVQLLQHARDHREWAEALHSTWMLAGGRPHWEGKDADESAATFIVETLLLEALANGKEVAHQR
jgi:hypothetical protein